MGFRLKIYEDINLISSVDVKVERGGERDGWIMKGKMCVCGGGYVNLAINWGYWSKNSIMMFTIHQYKNNFD